MQQQGPALDILSDLVAHLSYRRGWNFRIDKDLDRGQGSRGATLLITVHTVNSYDQDEPKGVVHYMLIPPAAYNRQSWQRWLLEQVLLVEQHEACEFFTVDGAKPFAPRHGPGNDPYTIVEYAADLDRRTSFRGELNAR